MADSQVTMTRSLDLDGEAKRSTIPIGEERNVR